MKEDWPMPGKLERGEVLIRVQAAALNPVYVLLIFPRPTSNKHLQRLETYAVASQLGGWSA